MKVVIFAGGLGSRITEESHLKPKPMIEIGGRPILWHIMKIYETHGFNEFVVCLGYKGQVIKDYFMNYFNQHSDITVDLGKNELMVHKTNVDQFKITLVDTGLHTLTAGRLHRIKDYIEDDDFFLTYGDGLANIDLNKELEFHKNHGKIGTMSVVQPAGKFGALEFNDEKLVTNFKEKPKGDKSWINGGFFILNKRIFDYLDDTYDNVMWEEEPLENLTKMGELMVYQHGGFWKCMDAMRDKIILEQMWNDNDAKWKIW